MYESIFMEPLQTITFSSSAQTKSFSVGVRCRGRIRQNATIITEKSILYLDTFYQETIYQQVSYSYVEYDILVSLSQLTIDKVVNFTIRILSRNRKAYFGIKLVVFYVFVSLQIFPLPIFGVAALESLRVDGVPIDGETDISYCRKVILILLILFSNSKPYNRITNKICVYGITNKYIII